MIGWVWQYSGDLYVRHPLAMSVLHEYSVCNGCVIGWVWQYSGDLYNQA